MNIPAWWRVFEPIPGARPIKFPDGCVAWALMMGTEVIDAAMHQ